LLVPRGNTVPVPSYQTDLMVRCFRSKILKSNVGVGMSGYGKKRISERQ
jgi:hypothetical protein